MKDPTVPKNYLNFKAPNNLQISGSQGGFHCPYQPSGNTGESTTPIL